MATYPCPSCRTALQIPPWLTARRLTCPRCLADLENPAVPAPPTGDRRPCPFCAEDISVNAKICPFCREPTDEFMMEADLDVQRDTGRVRVGLSLLVAVGIFGTLALLLTFRWQISPLQLGILLTLFAGLVGTGVALKYSKPTPVTRGVSRAIFGTLAVAGGLFIVAFLFGLAAFVYLFVICMTEGFKV